MSVVQALCPFWEQGSRAWYSSEQDFLKIFLFGAETAKINIGVHFLKGQLYPQSCHPIFSLLGLLSCPYAHKIFTHRHTAKMRFFISI